MERERHSAGPEFGALLNATIGRSCAVLEETSREYTLLSVLLDILQIQPR
jgi:hypothetical protein